MRICGRHGNACIRRQICGRWHAARVRQHGRLLPCETEAELNAALSSGANTVHVSQDAIVAVNGAVSIPRGVTLKLLSGARLSIADGALLINTGAIELSETAALHISHGAQYIRGGEEKFSGTVTGLDPQPRLFNSTTARTVGLFTDASAEYAPLCTDAVRMFEDMRLRYALSIGKSIARHGHIV